MPCATALYSRIHQRRYIDINQQGRILNTNNSHLKKQKEKTTNVTLLL